VAAAAARLCEASVAVVGSNLWRFGAELVEDTNAKYETAPQVIELRMSSGSKKAAASLALISVWLQCHGS
jgi:hypothetical protein